MHVAQGFWPVFYRHPCNVLIFNKGFDMFCKSLTGLAACWRQISRWLGPSGRARALAKGLWLRSLVVERLRVPLSLCGLARNKEVAGMASSKKAQELYSRLTVSRFSFFFR